MTKPKWLGAALVLLLVGAMTTPASAYRRPALTERVNENPILEYKTNSGAIFLTTDITPDGRYLAFDSFSSQIVQPDLNLAEDVFVQDRRSGLIDLVSVASDGSQGVLPSIGCGAPSIDPSTTMAAHSDQPSISADGRYVAFKSLASDLVPGDTNRNPDTFVHDRRKGTTIRVSVSSTGEQAVYGDTSLCNAHPRGPQISANGRYVVFESDASNLVKGDKNDGCNAFMHDLKKRTTTLVTVGSGGRQGSSGPCGSGGPRPSISSDGRYVAFSGSGFVEDEQGQVYVKDMLKDKVEIVSVDSAGTPRGGTLCCIGHGGRQISADGRYVTFSSSTGNLIPNDTNRRSLTSVISASDIFVHDRKSDRTERVSVTAVGEQGEWGDAFSPAISPDGRFVTFQSGADNLSGGGDTSLSILGQDVTFVLGGDHDVYLFDRRMGTQHWVTVALDGAEARCPSGACSGFGSAMAGAVSAGGRFVSFGTPAENLVSGDDNGVTDLFVRDLGPALGAGTGSVPEVEGGNGTVQRGFLALSDTVGEVPAVWAEAGADLIGATIAHRSLTDDLFVRIEVDSMPSRLDPRSVATGSSLLYGLRFEAAGKTYEIRAANAGSDGDLATGRASFGLFDCSASMICTKVAKLHGGYGTTGAEVVVSLPLSVIGVNATLKNIEAFTGIGTYDAGAIELLDKASVSS